MKKTSSLLKDSVRNAVPLVAALLIVGGYAFLCPYATAQEPPPPPPPAAVVDAPPVPPQSAAEAPDGPRSGDGFRGPQGRDRRPGGRDAECSEGPPQRGEGGRDRRQIDLVQRFKDLDANGDGVITQVEFMDFHARMRPQDGRGQSRREGPPAYGKSDDRQGPPPNRPRGPRRDDDMRGPGGPERGRPEPPNGERGEWNDRPMDGSR